MIFFQSDYSQGAHPKVMEALASTNLEHTVGYGVDEHCVHAAKLVKELIGIEDCDVHMMVGGTPCNVTVIAAALKPYEAVVAARTGHIYSHETGGVEGTGHRIITMPGVDGKMTPALIDAAFVEYEDEHTVLPRMVYISQPTEIGTIYSKVEVEAISEKCKERNMLLYIDGARLGSALTCKENDLSIKELARLSDAFYIGGTKNGALFGEALVIRNPIIGENFRFMIKRQCNMMAKGRLMGVQFEALLEGGENSIYFEMARHANELAEKLRNGLLSMGVEFYSKSPTNQIFPILPRPVVDRLKRGFAFQEWAPEKDGMVPIRLVTGWGSNEGEVDAFLAHVKIMLEMPIG